MWALSVLWIVTEALVEELISERVGESTDKTLFFGSSSKSLRQLLMHGSTIINGHQANDAFFLINGIGDAKAAHAILA